jgi:hypothetical protein
MSREPPGPEGPVFGYSELDIALFPRGNHGNGNVTRKGVSPTSRAHTYGCVLLYSCLEQSVDVGSEAGELSHAKLSPSLKILVVDKCRVISRR